MRYIIVIGLVLASGCGHVFKGQKGDTGAQGPQGSVGASGATCSVVSNGTGATIECTDGTSSVITNGLNGVNGTNGTNGTNGAASTPCSVTAVGTSSVISCPDGSQSTVNNVQLVQFCPSYGATTYPSNFPEYGFCIGNNIYATYWNGSQAFTAEIVPGVYGSTSPQGCTFTVGTNCQVTQD